MNHPYPYYPAPYYGHPSYAPGSAWNPQLLSDMATGALVGAAAATAVQLRIPAEQRHNPLGEVLKAGAVTGLTVGAVNMVQHKLGQRNSVTNYAAMFLTGTAVMYALNAQTKKGES